MKCIQGPIVYVSYTIIICCGSWTNVHPRTHWRCSRPTVFRKQITYPCAKYKGFLLVCCMGSTVCFKQISKIGLELKILHSEVDCLCLKQLNSYKFIKVYTKHQISLSGNLRSNYCVVVQENISGSNS